MNVRRLFVQYNIIRKRENLDTNIIEPFQRNIAFTLHSNITDVSIYKRFVVHFMHLQQNKDSPKNLATQICNLAKPVAPAPMMKN